MTLFDNFGNATDLTAQLGTQIIIDDDLGPSVVVQVCGRDSRVPLELGLSTRMGSTIERVVVRGLKDLNPVTRPSAVPLYAAGYNGAVAVFENIDYRPTHADSAISVNFGPSVDWIGGSIEFIDTPSPFLSASYVSEISIRQPVILTDETIDQALYRGGFTNLFLEEFEVSSLGGTFIDLTSGTLTAVDFRVSGGTTATTVVTGSSLDALFLDSAVDNTVLTGPFLDVTDSDVVVFQSNFANLDLTTPLIAAEESDVLVISSTLSGVESEEPIIETIASTVQLVNDRYSTSRFSAVVAQLDGGTLAVTDGRYEVPEAPEDWTFVVTDTSVDIDGALFVSPIAGAARLLSGDRSTIQLRGIEFGDFLDTGVTTPVAGPAISMRDSDLVLDESILVREVCSDGRFPPCAAPASRSPLIHAQAGSITMLGGALLNADGPVIDVVDTSVEIGDPALGRPFATEAAAYACDDLRYTPDGFGGGTKTAAFGSKPFPRLIAGGPAVTGRTLNADLGFCSYVVPSQTRFEALECLYGDIEPAGVTCDTANGCVCY